MHCVHWALAKCGQIIFEKRSKLGKAPFLPTAPDFNLNPRLLQGVRRSVA